MCSLGKWLGEVENDVLVDGHEEHLAVELEDVAAFGGLEGSDLLCGASQREEGVSAVFFLSAHGEHGAGESRGEEGRDTHETLKGLLDLGVVEKVAKRDDERSVGLLCSNARNVVLDQLHLVINVVRHPLLLLLLAACGLWL